MNDEVVSRSGATSKPVTDAMREACDRLREYVDQTGPGFMEWAQLRADVHALIALATPAQSDSRGVREAEDAQDEWEEGLDERLDRDDEWRNEEREKRRRAALAQSDSRGVLEAAKRFLANMREGEYDQQDLGALRAALASKEPQESGQCWCDGPHPEHDERSAPETDEPTPRPSQSDCQPCSTCGGSGEVYPGYGSVAVTKPEPCPDCCADDAQGGTDAR